MENETDIEKLARLSAESKKASDAYIEFVRSLVDKIEEAKASQEVSSNP